MSALFAMNALLFAGECLVASVLVMGAAWLAARVVKRASMRHLVWSTAMGVLLVFPAVALIAPSQPFLVTHAAMATQHYSIDAPGLATVAVAAEIVPPPGHGIDPRDAALWLFGLWLIGVAWFALRMAVGAFGLCALRRDSRRYALRPEDLPHVATDRRECELRLSNAETGPLTWGIFKPVILLPRSAPAWPRERLHAVLLHELAHVRRNDGLTRMLSLAISTLYWPNPLVWCGVRALRREAEMAADDVVIAAGMKPSAYAADLVGLASTFGRRRAAAETSLAMAAPSSLEARVKSVLAPAVERSGVTSMDVLKIALVGILASTAMACARPSFAETAPQSHAAPQAAPAAVAAMPAPPAAAPAPPARMSAPPPAAAVAPLPALPPLPAAKGKAAHTIVVRSEERTIDGRKHQRIEVVMDGAHGKVLDTDLTGQGDAAKALAKALAALNDPHLDVQVHEHVNKGRKRTEVKIIITKRDKDKDATRHGGDATPGEK